MDYLLDVVIVIVLLLFVMLSIKRGFAAELRGLTGWVIILLISLRFGAWVGDYLSTHMSNLAGISTYVGFILLAAALKLAFIGASQVFESNEMGFIDKLFSGIVGIVKGALLLSIVFILLSSTPLHKETKPYIDKSITYPYLYGFSTEFVNILTRFVPQLDQLYERMMHKSSKIQEQTNETIQEKIKEFRQKSEQEPE